MEITFDKFIYPNDLQRQRELFVECFPENIGTSAASIEHYLWKFRSFPNNNTDKAYEYVARLDGRIVGYYAGLPYEYLVSTKKVKVAMVCDVMTAKEARGKGIFTKLGIYATSMFKEAGCSFSIGFPIRPEVIPGHLKAGWKVLFRIPMVGRFMRTDKFLEYHGLGVLSHGANVVTYFLSKVITLLNPIRDDVSVEDYSSSHLENIDGLDEFFEAYKIGREIELNKTVNYLKWRLGAPDREYRIIVIRKDQKIVGYSLVRKVTKEGTPCLGVLDLCLLKGYESYSKYIVDRMTKLAKDDDIELILMMIMDDKIRDYRLYKNGFMKTPYKFSFIVKELNNDIYSSALSNKRNWDLMWIDSDDL